MTVNQSPKIAFNRETMASKKPFYHGKEALVSKRQFMTEKRWPQNDPFSMTEMHCP